MIKINFSTGNAAFSNDPLLESIVVLSGIVERLEHGLIKGRIYDRNGNDIGDYEYIEELINLKDLRDE